MGFFFVFCFLLNRDGSQMIGYKVHTGRSDQYNNPLSYKNGQHKEIVPLA